MTTRPDPVDRLLTEAAGAARWPTTPDLRASVVARIAAAPAGSAVTAGRTGHLGTGSPLLRALVLALVALLVAAGVATALGYRLPGLDIILGGTLPPAGTGLDLGTQVPLSDVVGLESPRVLLPDALPEPGAAFVRGSGDRRIVTFGWRATPGEPVLAGTDLSLTLMAVPGRAEDSLLRKMLGPDSTIEAVTVGGDRGWWISGTPHELLFVGPDGAVAPLAAVLAGDTLVFARDGTLYRLESALGRDRTLEIAETLR